MQRAKGGVRHRRMFRRSNGSKVRAIAGPSKGKGGWVETKWIQANVPPKAKKKRR